MPLALACPGPIADLCVRKAAGSLRAQDKGEKGERMRPGIGIGILALVLGGCSPAAHIAVTVRSASDVAFKVTTEKDDPGCLDHLVIRDAGGATRWEIARKAGERKCLREISFPKVPPGFTALQAGTVLARGEHQVEAKSGIYRGVARFGID